MYIYIYIDLKVGYKKIYCQYYIVFTCEGIVKLYLFT